MRVRDRRKSPFVWATTGALEHLRRNWKPSSPAVGVGICVYHALTEVANQGHARASIGTDSEQFRTSQQEIGKFAGASARTVGRACEELERIGLLIVDRDRDGDNRPGRPNFYTLVEPDQTCDESSHVGDGQRANACQTPSEAISDVSAQRATGVRTSLYREEERKEEEEEGAREGEPVYPSERSAKAWSDLAELLAGHMDAAKFRALIEPLEVIGERAKVIFLLDPTDQGGGSWIDETLRPIVLEAIDHFEGLVVVDRFELEHKLNVATEFDVWLLHFHHVTGRTAMTGSKTARRYFAARRAEGRSMRDLQLATLGCHSDPHLRREGFDRPETILAEANIGRYIERGKERRGKSRQPVGDPALAKITGRAA